jgi:hypothetical protein
MAVDATQAREQFHSHAVAHEVALQGSEPDPNEANRHVDAMNCLVAEWGTEAGTVLAPLLAVDQPSTVRSAAASYLIDRGHEEQAIAILESIKADPEASPTAKKDARSTLRWWRKQQQSG